MQIFLVFCFPKYNVMIKLQVIGHLGKDATVNAVNGKNVINFSIAHTEKFKDSQGTAKEKTTWVECAYWTDRTAIAPYLKKGTQVYAEGTPEVRTYQTQDGKSGCALSLRIMNVQLLGGKQNENGERSNYQPASAPIAATNYSSAAVPAHSEMGDSDDLPF